LICVICVICGLTRVGGRIEYLVSSIGRVGGRRGGWVEIRNSKSEIRNSDKGGQGKLEPLRI
jgi:hypothetical protein